MVVRRQAVARSFSADEDSSELEHLMTPERHPDNGRPTTTTTTTTTMAFGKEVGSSLTTTTTTASLNLDHLTNMKLRVVMTPPVSSRQRQRHTANPKNSSSSSSSSNRSGGKVYQTHYGPTQSCLEYAGSRVTFCLYHRPYTCAGILIFALLAVLIFLANLMNPVLRFASSSSTLEESQSLDRYSDIQSTFDLTMGAIDHWCLGGGNERCTCQDPLVPTHRGEHKSWIEAWKANRQVVQRFADPNEAAQLDVVFLGESIIEEMDGRWMGRRDRSPGLTRLAETFDKHFRRKTGASLEGIALGIAGDTSPNVLWRILQFPIYLQPKVWWISLGNNDLSRTECSEEVVVIGILRVVEEIMKRYPKAFVVINSMFPMTAIRGGSYPLISDYEDTFNNRPGGNGRSLAIDLDSLRALRSNHKRAPAVSQNPQNPSEIPQSVLVTNMTEEAEKEELRRDKAAKKKVTSGHSTKIMPVMKDREKIRKYDVSSTFLRQAEKPLWTSIRAINKALKKFAGKNGDRVAFFDVIDIFTENDGRTYKLQTDLISLRGHPTEKGFQQWEEKIVDELGDILTEMKVSQPELFSGSFTEPRKKSSGNSSAPEDDYIGNSKLDDFYVNNLFTQHGDDDFDRAPDPTVLDNTDEDSRDVDDDSDDKLETSGKHHKRNMVDD